MDDPQHLRAYVVQLYALALEIRDSQPAYAEMLIERAEELQREATAIETQMRPVPPPGEPQSPAQLQQQIKPETDDK